MCEAPNEMIAGVWAQAQQAEKSTIFAKCYHFALLVIHSTTKN
jgi:hypothetical protein